MKHAAKAQTAAARALEFAQGRSLVRAADAREAGIPAVTLSRLVSSGELERVSRGLYRHTEAPIHEHQELVEVGAYCPGGVVVLLSALRFHGLGTQQPHQVWLQLPMNSRVPQLKWPKLQIIRTRLASLFEEGVEGHYLGGIAVNVTSPARTVADCFKHRTKVGIDVGVEALRDLLARDRGAVDQLHHFGKLTRMEKIMRPYLEASV